MGTRKRNVERRVDESRRDANLKSHPCGTRPPPRQREFRSLWLNLIVTLLTLTVIHFSIVNQYYLFAAVRADRMRGGRNKFGPMYKRDRARKLQVMRERQLTTPRGGGGGGGTNPSPNNSNSGAGQSAGMYTEMGYSPSGGSVYGGVKHEIQIPQVSSLTSSPDSSPSPLAASLGYPGQLQLIWNFSG